MKFLVVLAVFILAVSAVTDREQWLQFKQDYGREYRNLREEHRRYTIFQNNLRTIEEHNEKYARGEKSYYLGVNQFADLTPAEFAAFLNTSWPTRDLPVQAFKKVEASAVPSAIDWRDKGVVTEVKSQGNCGGCWSFSATGSLEGAYAIKTGKLISLSEQNLIDCSSSYGNQGCHGGTIHSAFKYVIDNGIEKESDYTYRATQGTCAYSSALSALSVKSYVEITYDNENELQQAVGTVGPVSVSLNADGYQFYTGGVYDDPTCTWEVNHGVLVVGYGNQDGTDYWLVKNSWGASWGDKGYIKMARNKNDQCGIALWAVYPVL